MPSVTAAAKPTRRDYYGIFMNLRDAGCHNARIARIIGKPEPFVLTLDRVRQWPESRRNAWLMGLNVDKFNCG